MRIIENISYGEYERNLLDIYLPDSESASVMVYFHGGGIESGSKEEEYMVRIAKVFAQRGIAMVCPTYRLYPNAKYPEFIEDCAKAVAWVFENIKDYIAPEKIFVAGQSAGAYITQNLCFNGAYLGKYGITNDDIAGYYFDAGQPTTHFNILNERGLDPKQVVVDDAAPMYYIDGNAKYPPMLLVVSDNDMPNRYEQTMLLLAVLRNFGYDMNKIELIIKENSTHCAYNLVMDENGNPSMTEPIYEFIMKYK